jgi:hypothetical protein
MEPRGVDDDAVTVGRTERGRGKEGADTEERLLFVGVGMDVRGVINEAPFDGVGGSGNFAAARAAADGPFTLAAPAAETTASVAGCV